MRVLIFLILISVSSCNESKKKVSEIKSSEKTQIEFKLPKTDFVILNTQNKSIKSAELSQSELNDIEKILKIAIAENNDEQKRGLIEHNNKYPNYQLTETGFELKLAGYKRQYVPSINEKGEKEVWINFFCDDFGADNWKTEIVLVEDGGNCYFNIKINLKTKKYFELQINGNA